MAGGGAGATVVSMRSGAVPGGPLARFLASPVSMTLYAGLASVVLLWAGVILFRKWFDRGCKVPGFAPSWWNPLGVELILLRQWDRRKQPVGEALMQAFDSMMLSKLRAGCGVLRGFVFCLPAIVVSHADGIEVVLNSNRLINKSIVYKFLENWLGTGLLTSNGQKWRSRRKMLTPTFHFRILEDFMPIFNDHSADFVRALADHEGLKPINITSPVTTATLEIICETAMGVKIHASESGAEYFKALQVVGAGFIERIAKPWLWSNLIYNISPEGRHVNKSLEVLHNFTRKVIEDRKAEMLAEANGVAGGSSSSAAESEVIALGMRSRRPFLNLLLEKHLQQQQQLAQGLQLDEALLTLEDIREEVDTFMFEGHDTTSMGISWALYLLSVNRFAQENVHKEMDEIFGDDRDRAMTSEDLANMKYLDRCIKESQRLYPSVPFIARLMTEETNIGEYTIKAGTVVALHIYRLHRDPSVFPSPEDFDPDRFLPENCAGRHPFAYVPFSAGPRNCIGQKFAQMEMKVMVASVLRRFSLESSVQRDQLRLLGELVTRSHNGLSVRIMPRQH